MRPPSQDYTAMRAALTRASLPELTPSPSPSPVQAIRTRLRHFFLLICFVLAADWGSSWLAQRYFASAVIRNPNPPPVSLLVFLVVGFSFMTFIFRNRVGLIGAAFCCGGAAANILAFAAFGPVVDFIHEPFISGDWECNPADIAIWSGSVLLIFALLLFLRDHYRYERAHSAARAARRVSTNV
jgi:hypothetical protein